MSASATESPPSPRVRIVGPGRAGGALALALGSAGWRIADALGRRDDLSPATADVDVVVIATPDRAVEQVAAAITPREEVLVVHLAGSLGVGALAGHPRRAAVHPLVPLPSAEVGARRLRGAWFAVAGDPAARQIPEDLQGRWFEVADEDRASYHAAAAIASNHLVAVLGQAERVATSAGVPLEAYMDLARATVQNVAELGPAGALTGPAARGEEETLQRHRAALDPSELAAYDVMVDEIVRLAAQRERP